MVKRKKAFIGTAISVAGNVLGGIINRNRQKRLIEQQQKEQNIANNLQTAGNITAAYTDQEYADEFKNKFVLKNGGKVNMKKNNYNDRIKVAKKFKCGGRKKANLGVYLDDAGNVVTNAGIDNDFQTNPFTTYNDRLMVARFGGKKRCK